MNNERAMFDVQVVGGGFSGLMAALFAARQGKRVRLIQRGNGAVGIGGGAIDVLGYTPDGTAATSPLEALSSLPTTHPYTLAGKDTVSAALKAFMDICAQAGYAYVCNGTPEAPKATHLLTCIGTAKPSALVPQTMSMHGLEKAQEVIVLGIEGLKDMFPRFAAESLARLPSLQNKRITPLTIAAPAALLPGADTPGTRDLSTLDVARFADTPEGAKTLVDRIVRAFHTLSDSTSRVLLTPPILGSMPYLRVHSMLEQAIKCPVYELLAPPPAVTGLRLRALIMEQLRQHNVEIVCNATVIRTERDVNEQGQPVCSAIFTYAAGQERRWTANAHIIATGGIYGEGLVVQPSSVFDAIFPDAALTSTLTPASPQWSTSTAFPSAGEPTHGFASLGVRVDDHMRPLNASGQILCHNVRMIGRAVGGYDYAVEKSGNGVALVTAYKAISTL